MERVNQASPNSVPGLAPAGSGHRWSSHETFVLWYSTTIFEVITITSIIVLIVIIAIIIIVIIIVVMIVIIMVFMIVLIVSTAFLHSLTSSFLQSVSNSVVEWLVQWLSHSVTPSLTFSLPHSLLKTLTLLITSAWIAVELPSPKKTMAPGRWRFQEVFHGVWYSVPCRQWTSERKFVQSDLGRVSPCGGWTLENEDMWSWYHWLKQPPPWSFFFIHSHVYRMNKQTSYEFLAVSLKLNEAQKAFEPCCPPLRPRVSLCFILGAQITNICAKSWGRRVKFAAVVTLDASTFCLAFLCFNEFWDFFWMSSLYIISYYKYQHLPARFHTQLAPTSEASETLRGVGSHCARSFEGNEGLNWQGSKWGKSYNYSHHDMTYSHIIIYIYVYIHIIQYTFYSYMSYMYIHIYIYTYLYCMSVRMWVVPCTFQMGYVNVDLSLQPELIQSTLRGGAFFSPCASLCRIFGTLCQKWWRDSFMTQRTVKNATRSAPSISWAFFLVRSINLPF